VYQKHGGQQQGGAEDEDHEDLWVEVYTQQLIY
jgi:hypothetical protein